MRKFKNFKARGLFFFGFMLVFLITGMGVSLAIKNFQWPEILALVWGIAVFITFCIIQFVWRQSDQEK